MQQFTFSYFYPVNRKNLIKLQLYRLPNSLDIAIDINEDTETNHLLDQPAEYDYKLSKNDLKIAHQIVDVLNSVKRYVKRNELKNNSWGISTEDYPNALHALNKKAANFQKHNKNYVLSIILANPSLTSSLLKTIKFCLMKEKYGPLVIGIHGAKGTGKTTLAKTIIQELNYSPNTLYSSSIYHFADPLKRAASNLLGIPVKVLERLKNKTECIQGSSVTYRQFLQTLGTEFMQSANKYWATDLAEKYLKEVSENTDIVIIPDVRFEHEVKFIKEKYKGTLVKLIREDHTVKDDHASEQGIPDHMFDTVVSVTTKNDTSIAANAIISTYVLG